MPNTGHYTQCPYFIAEKNKTVHCEDTFRRFKRLTQKQKWMKQFCDDSWKECPYAIEITKIYERIEKGEADMTEMKKRNLQELEKEYKKLNAQLGKAEKRLKEKDGDIERLKKRNRLLDNHYNELLRRFREKNIRLNEYEAKERKASDDAMPRALEIATQCAEMVNGLTAYLMSVNHHEKVYLTNVEAWQKNKDAVIVKRDSSRGPYWELVVEEKKDGNEKISQ